MTDFYISAVSYSLGGEHIERVKVRRNLGKQIGPELVTDRELVANLIAGNGVQFKTITRGANGWVPGADVHVYEDSFIASAPNASLHDNLDGLPRF